MYCPVCGFDAGNESVCPCCKSVIQQPQQQSYQAQSTGSYYSSQPQYGEVPSKAKAFSIVCLVAGIVSLAALALPAGIVSLVMASLYYKATAVYDKKVEIGRKLAIAGIIVSAIAIVFYVIFYLFIYGEILSELYNSPSYYYYY
ncbi:MAG: DUF4190 domain-containing protein [Clostridia bacterium]|nr:DUF4190 domain-containing protein [Clostridia bacterium]